MNQLANYDPYTIQEIQFFIQKKSKYTTLKSIMISFIIFSLSIIVSYDSLKNIWVSKTQLDIYSSNQKLSTQKLTQNYLCVISKNLSSNAPNSTLINQFIKNGTKFFQFSSTNKFNTVPQIISMTNGKNFYCYDIAGGILNTQSRILLTVSGNADFIFKSYTVSQILGQQGSHYQYITPLYDNKKNVSIYTKKLKSIVYDKLLIDYQPQYKFGFKNQTLIITYNQAAGSTLNFVQLTSETIKDNELTQQIFIKRQDIGSIIGKFFSWFTIFVLLFTYIIAPIVQYTFKVQLCKSIYDNKQLQNIEPSLLSYIKYILSKIKKGCFYEDALHIGFQKLQNDINVINLMLNQQMMRKLIKQGKLIKQKAQQYHEKLDKNEEKQSQIDYKTILLQIQNQNQNNIKQNQCEERQFQNKVQSQKLQEEIIEIKKDQKSRRCKVLDVGVKNLDIGETVVSLVSNKGQGYKNSWNSIIFTILLFLVMVFLIFAGVFTLKISNNVSTTLEGTQALENKQIIISPSDIIFRALKTSPSDKFVLQVKIVNQTYDIIQNITLVSGPQCDNYTAALNQTVGSGWLCLPNPIKLSNSGKSNKKSLVIRLYFGSGFAFTSSKIQITYRQTNLINYELTNKIVQIKQKYSSSTLRVYEVQLLQRSSLKDTQKAWTSYQASNNDDAPFKGVSIQMLSDYVSSKQVQTTIWDIIDASWGIFILTFSILLSRVGNYLNLRQRQRIASSEQNENRNNIVGIVSRLYNLRTKIYRDQLKEISYFYKRELDRQGSGMSIKNKMD